MIELRKQRRELEAALSKAEEDDDEKAVEDLRKTLKKLTEDEIQIRMRISGLQYAEAEKASEKRRQQQEEDERKRKPLRDAAADLDKNRIRAGEIPDSKAMDAIGFGLTDWQKDASAAMKGAGMDGLGAMATAAMRLQELDLKNIVAPLSEAEKAQMAWKDSIKQTTAEIETLGGSTMQGLASSVAGAFRPMLTHSTSYTRAMRAAGKEIENTSDLSGPAFAAMAQNALAGLAVEAAQRAIFYTAEGFSMLFTNPAGASTKFVAAGLMAGIAGGAGGGAYAIGQNRGMTAAERQSVEDQKKMNEKPLDDGGGSFSSGRSGDGSIVRETRIVFLPPLMTEAEAAQWVTRAGATAARLDLARREA
jgi:hypothetical protein